MGQAEGHRGWGLVRTQTVGLKIHQAGQENEASLQKEPIFTTHALFHNIKPRWDLNMSPEYPPN